MDIACLYCGPAGVYYFSLRCHPQSEFPDKPYLAYPKVKTA